MVILANLKQVVKSIAAKVNITMKGNDEMIFQLLVCTAMPPVLPMPGFFSSQSDPTEHSVRGRYKTYLLLQFQRGSKTEHFRRDFG